MAKIQTSQKKSCFYGIKFENLKPWRNTLYPGNDTIVKPMNFFPPTQNTTIQHTTIKYTF